VPLSELLHQFQHFEAQLKLNLVDLLNREYKGFIDLTSDLVGMCGVLCVCVRVCVCVCVRVCKCIVCMCVLDRIHAILMYTIHTGTHETLASVRSMLDPVKARLQKCYGAIERSVCTV
jgi:hypothetical protein